MTAKRQSLLDKGVIKRDFADSAQLLAKENVNFELLCEYAKEAAYVSTNKKLSSLTFAKNHYGQVTCISFYLKELSLVFNLNFLNFALQADVAMFDFTSLFQAENSTRIVEKHGKRILLSLVGDSLLEVRKHLDEMWTFYEEIHFFIT